MIHLQEPACMIKGIVKASALFTMGNMMPLLTSVVLLFPYTENLSTALYGELALYIAFTIFIQFTANYGMDNYVGIQHFRYKKDPEQMKAFVGSVVGALLVIGIVLITVFLLLGSFIFQMVFHGELDFFPFGFMCVITGVCNAFFRTYINFLYYRDKPVRHVVFNLFNFVVTIAVCTIGVYRYPEALTGPIWGRFLSGIAIFLLSAVFFQREYGIRFNRSYLEGLHKFCFPVYIYVILGWVVFYINSFIINYYNTTSDVGIYDFALKVVLLIDVTQTAVSATINPRIYQIWTDTGMQKSTTGENRFHHVFTMFSVIMIAVSILALPLLVQLFVRNESYYAIFPFIPVLAVSFAFRVLANTYYNPLMYFKKTGGLPRAYGYSSLVQIVSCVAFLQWFGLEGAFWSFFLSKVAVVFFSWMESRKIFRFEFNNYKMFLLPILYVLTTMTIFYLIPQNQYFLAASLQLAVAGILVLLFFRKDLGAYRLLLNR